MAERSESEEEGSKPTADTDATGVDTDWSEDDGSLSIEEALSILGEPTRADIVVALGEAVPTDGNGPEPLSFSELQDLVGAEDSGRFNYHLDKLVGAFVARTDDGYLLRPPGHFLYRAIVAGTLTERPSLEPFDVGDCPDCGATLTAEYPATHCLSVGCPDCGQFEHTVHLTPRGVEGRTRAGTLDAAVRKGRHDLGLLVQGVCPACGSPSTRELTRDGPEVCAARCGYDVYAVVSCAACNAGGSAHPAHVALTTPAVVGFFDEHGRDARAVGHWESPVPEAEAETTVVSSDPLRVAVPFDLDGERLCVVLDSDLQTVETERSDR